MYGRINMTPFEVFGIILSAVMTGFAIILTMLAAESVKMKLVNDTIIHLRWSGIMTFASFCVMISLFYKCETICWVTRNESTTNKTEVTADKINIVASTGYIETTTPKGTVTRWDYIQPGPLSSIFRRTGFNSDTDRLSSGSIGTTNHSIKTTQIIESF